jgi:hypothetical protein
VVDLLKANGDRAHLANPQGLNWGQRRVNEWDEPYDGTGKIEVLEALIDQFATAGTHLSAYPVRSLRRAPPEAVSKLSLGLLLEKDCP